MERENYNTLEYYNKNALAYFEQTIVADLQIIYNKFLSQLPQDGYILDFGCGSGRDSMFFKEHDYEVVALDGSKEMCEITRKLCNIEVKEMFFEDFNEVNTYDGIWACASLLHLPKEKLIPILKNLSSALKDNGYIYTSFKYGNFEGIRNERYFLDMTEESFGELISEIPELEVVETYQTNGLLSSQIRKHWLNIILKKKNY